MGKMYQKLTKKKITTIRKSNSNRGKTNEKKQVRRKKKKN